MSSVAKRNRKPEPYLARKSTPPQPGDERNGDYSREHLLKMDARFVARVERAFRLGLESRAAAAGHVAASAALCVSLRPACELVTCSRPELQLIASAGRPRSRARAATPGAKSTRPRTPS